MRILAILHLCIVFSIICWTLGRPFTEELYNYRTLRASYRTVIGDEKLGEEFPLEKDKIFQYHQFFTMLPTSQQQQINDDYEQLQEKISEGFQAKSKKALNLLLFKLPVFERAWLFFSLILAVMVLKQRAGVRQAIWILPILTCCYAVDQTMAARNHPSTAMMQLVPTEKELTDKYLGHPIDGNIEQQKRLLLQLWEQYLIEVWSQKITYPESSPLVRGEYAFSLARLEALQLDTQSQEKGRSSPDSSLALMVFIFWNLLFAVSVSRPQNLP